MSKIDVEIRTDVRVGGGNERVEIYDWLRLIATIFVIIGHSAYLSISTTYGGVAYELPENLSTAYNSAILSSLRYLAGWVYGFHMPLFFMLSGALLEHRSIPQYDRFVTSKVKRLLIPYFLWGWLFMLPVKYAGNFYNAESIYSAMRGFLSGQDSGHLWFLTALFWCMICFVLIQKILASKAGSVYILLLISGVVSLTYSYLPFDILGLKMGLSYIFWFALGYVFEYERKSHTAWNIKKTILASIVLIVIEMLHVKHGVLNNFFVILCGSFLTFLLADLCSRVFANFSKTWGWKIITRNLFYVYLFHDPMEYIVLRTFFAKNLLETALGCYAYAFCRTVLIFVLSILLGEGVRLTKERRSINYKTLTAAAAILLAVVVTAATIKRSADRRLGYQLSSLTDQNWTAGYRNTANILLFEYDEELLADLLKSKNVLCEGNSFLIENIDYDNKWIRVSVGADASICKYPNYIQLE